ncbi:MULTISPECIES: glycoside hydrolase family 99-like domain-containing protein [unclassified Ruegeria]|uniref:glycoside hydrolase family 99-like domain-containing protein n=1 Tax=unclassified Ruegeria TaxID=2625375 RepID=UPI001489501B|nr:MULTISPECIES: glycoside hydrolase family 99-like domain-containing protein [unclassified Ruegeria]NOD64537.1 methyltransferase domain-containing protein [Ruegeria sp. HKCCD6109]
MTKDGKDQPAKLPADGERYLPEFQGTIELEHLHRYQLARSLADGLDVLDIACGEGYGTDIIAASAKSVIGVDVSASAVEHAKFHYRDPRLCFRAGSATDIPIPDQSVDLVVSFETIEHLEEHDRMIQEVRRVLRPGGLLLISSPNKYEYSDKPGYSNPFHVKELYTDEFLELIGRYFPNTCHYGQRLSAASLIANKQTLPFRVFSGSGVRDGIPNARYDLVLASDSELPELPNSAYEIPGGSLEPYAAEEALKHTAELQRAQIELKETLSERDEIISERDEIISHLIGYLQNMTISANEVVQSKWWRGTRLRRRLSNSLRKRRGRPKKIWPKKFETPELVDRIVAGATGVELGLTDRRAAAAEGVVSPFGRYGTGPDVPVVQYSEVQERFVDYVSHDKLETDVKAIAFYLPQFHPFPENDKWWGKGFTEWTNVGKARPLFSGHYQPHCPIHLGYYDLRLPSVMEEQAKLARNYGVSGFAYYFYWFAGKLLMEKPLEAMRDNPDVDMPYCMIWANENWTRRWDGLDQEILISQDHSLEDSRAMLLYLETYMKDSRYIRINGKPLFIVYRAHLIPDFKETVQMWREQAKEMGLSGLYIVSAQTDDGVTAEELGLDAVMQFPPHAVNAKDVTRLVDNLTSGFEGGIYDYDDIVSKEVRKKPSAKKTFRTAMLSWDNTARRGLKASVFTDFSLTRYSQWLSANIENTAKNPVLTDDERIVFINAWNEWAEGTHLEPDQHYGYGYLDATRKVLADYDSSAARFLRPEIPKTTDAKYAIVAHVHYADTWPELKELIDELPQGMVDVYVTVTSLETALTVSKSMPEAHVELVDNRGRDVRPFLLTIKRIAHLNYRALCKVHGKKSVYRVDGDKIRKSTLSALINKSAFTKFETDPSLGMLASPESIHKHDSTNMHHNLENVKNISRQIGIEYKKGKFVAGTMFWITPAAIEPLLKLDTDDFDVERGLADGTRAHAIERIFVNLVENLGFRLEPFEGR